MPRRTGKALLMPPNPPGRPKKIRAEHPVLDWEFKGNMRLGYTSQSLYICDYNNLKLFKQVFRFRNGNCFATYYTDNTKQLYRTEMDLIKTLEIK